MSIKKVIFNDGVEIIPRDISDNNTNINGIVRPSLVFKFDNNNNANLTLESLSAIFSRERCDNFTIINDMNISIYENYSLISKLAIELEKLKDDDDNDVYIELIVIEVAKRTESEIQYEKLVSSLKETKLALAEVSNNK